MHLATEGEGCPAACDHKRPCLRKKGHPGSHCFAAQEEKFGITVEVYWDNKYMELRDRVGPMLDQSMPSDPFGWPYAN